MKKVKRQVRSKVCIIRIPEREKREKGQEAQFKEIMAENISKLTHTHTNYVTI